jgi:hypothetical protein
MLPLSDPVLSMRTRTRKLSKGTLISEVATMSRGDVFTSRVSAKSPNRRSKLSTNHSGKLLVNRKKLATRGHQINPSESRIVINEDNIIRVTSFGHKRSTAPYIRVNKIKGALGYRLTRRIRELQLFAKLATRTMESTSTRNRP